MSLGATGIEVLGPLEANPTAIRWPFGYQVTGTSLTLAEPVVGFWESDAKPCIGRTRWRHAEAIDGATASSSPFLHR